jgi:glycosyltransferase involved in cell wall biosynthesis
MKRRLQFMPTISVIIPIWNRAGSVGRAIDSVLSQQLPNGHSLEVNVVDDGSSDQPQEKLARFGDRIKLLRHPENLGAAAARNTGCEAATGEYIAFLDSDDRWLPGKLVAQLAFMQENAYEVSCTSFLLERRPDRVIVSPRNRTASMSLSDMVWGCFVSPGSTLLCRQAVFRDVGPLDTTLRRLEDWDWLMRVTRSRRLGFLAQPLASIEPSVGADPATVLSALESIFAKHLPGLTGASRRHFKAGYHLQRAAALLRSQGKARAAGELLLSFGLSPLNHQALMAILHNRLARAGKA